MEAPECDVEQELELLFFTDYDIAISGLAILGLFSMGHELYLAAVSYFYMLFQ
ncbi:hypothetical protein FVER14953_21709 [Fusarium verticillioides]|nr:hypothetical protein FVER14953_21709 [Fusarium verticillioides]